MGCLRHRHQHRIRVLGAEAMHEYMCICVSCRYQTEFCLSIVHFPICSNRRYSTSHDFLYLIVFYFELLGWCFWHQCEIVFEKPESFLWVWNLVMFGQLNIFRPLVIHHQRRFDSKHYCQDYSTSTTCI